MARLLLAFLFRTAKAEELIAGWRLRVADLDRRLRGVKPVRVLSVGAYPFTAGADTTFQDACDHAGALNVAAEQGLRGHEPTPSERIITWKVDVLVVGREPGIRERLKQTVPYKFMEPLQKGQVVELPEALLSATSQARLDTYEALARALHPEVFP